MNTTTTTETTDTIDADAPLLPRDLAQHRLEAVAIAHRDRDDLTAQEIADALDAARCALGALETLRIDLERAALDVIDGPVMTDNWLVRPGESTKRNGWKKAELLAEVKRKRMRVLVDPESGEHVEAFPAREVGDTLQLRTGVHMMRGLGLDIDDYSTETTSTVLEWMHR